MLKIFFLLNLFLFLEACTYQYADEDDLDIEGIKKIYLNVKSFQINKNSLESIENDDSLRHNINKRVLNKLEDWVWEKFTILGNENSAYLSVLKIDTNLIEKSKDKKKIISIIQQSNKTYKIALKFDLTVNSNDGLIKTLKISSNLDFVLLNKLSINQRDKVIIYNINKLIKLIDEKVTAQLNQEAFKQFVTK